LKIDAINFGVEFGRWREKENCDSNEGIDRRKKMNGRADGLNRCRNDRTKRERESERVGERGLEERERERESERVGERGIEERARERGWEKEEKKKLLKALY
jgi:hypothetical protein